MAHTTSRGCPHCGATPTNHFVAKTNVIVGFLMRVITFPFGKIEDAIARVVFPLIERALPAIFRGLSFVGLGRISEYPENDNVDRTKFMWEAANKRSIEIRQFRIFGRPTILFWATCGGKRIVFEGLPRPIGVSTDALTWMDNKALLKRKLQAGGIPVANGGSAMTVHGALKLFRNIGHPVITKPNLGSRSRHTTIHIDTEEALVRGFKIARQLSPWVMVEEELQGFVFRITLIGGKLAGALRREPPFVTGDGIHTVRELVIAENKNPKRHGGVFHEISFDADADAELVRQKLAWDTISPRGLFISLNQKVGRSQGGSNTEMLANVHPENVKLFEKMARVLGDALVGVDFIMEDVRRPWTEQKKCGAIECNSLPFLDLHHVPLYGTPTDPSGALWDIVFPEAKRFLVER